MNDAQIQKIRDLQTFAKTFLTIRAKAGTRKNFDMNRAQLYLHERLEKQKQQTGKVRAVILKGRQQGCSTYVQARYFHNVITSRGKKAFILTHEAEATKNLFEMTRRFYDNLPHGLCPVADTSSAKELSFRAFDSGYAVGTAGNKSVGRSQTIQLFHGSECAYWPHSEQHAKGILQTISNEIGTEIILESTANGLGNYFHNLWCAATQGDSDYQAIFIPWFWQDEYKNQKAGFALSEDEKDLLDIYEKDGLTKGHLAWRRVKVREFSNDFDVGVERFKCEYPFSADEAFLNPIENIFISTRSVSKAREADVHSDAALVIGVDVAISSYDRTAIIRRKGRCAYNLEKLANLNTMEICGYLKRVIQEEKPTKVYIDCIGVGAGVVDRMREMGYYCVQGINVARSANDKEKFRNLRAELWHEMREWLSQEMPVKIPDSDDLHGELCCLGYKYTSSGQLQIESKIDLRKRGMPSPDGADALALSFAHGFYEVEHTSPVRQLNHYEKSMFI